jgi:UDP-N-acetylglucosamine transferase subunit ALG13
MSIDGAVEDDNIIFIDFVDPQLFHDLVYRARVIIGHAGVGTYLSCRKYGKIPLMMAREKQYFEHVDDHQLQYLKVLVERGDAFAVNSSEDIRKVNSFTLVRPVQNLNERLIEDLKKYLECLK